VPNVEIARPFGSAATRPAYGATAGREGTWELLPPQAFGYTRSFTQETDPKRFCVKLIRIAALAFGLAVLGCDQEDPDPSLFEVPDGILQVRTVDEDGAPITGATVRINGSTASIQGEAYGTTPADVPLQPGSYQTTVELEGFVVAPTSRSARILGTRTTTIQFTLEPGIPPPARIDVAATVATGAGSDPVAGLPIFVDDVQRAERTPAMLELTAGTYRVALGDSLGLYPTSAREVTVTILPGETEPATFSYTPGFARTLLIEDFTNTGCGPCPPAEEALLRVTDAYAFDEVVTLHVHTLQPGVTDPMYWANAPELGARFTYYTLSGDPTFVLNGSRVLFPTPPEAELADSVAAHRDDVAQVYLEVDYTINGTNVQAHATLRSLEDLSGDYRLIVVTIQKLIDYPTPPGTNGQKTFVRTARDFLPDSDGEPVTLTAGLSTSFDYEAPLLDASHLLANPPDDPAQVGCVVVLQEWTTKEIIQVASTLD
jgi:hypothetical protein